jgi:predicted O-methyltransferase YrrM
VITHKECVDRFLSVVEPLYRPVAGWLPGRQAFALYRMGMNLPDYPVVVEIGSWRGKSAVVLGHSVIDKVGARVFCVDPWDRSGGPQYLTTEPDVDNFQDFTSNIEKAGVSHIVEPVKGYSANIGAIWSLPIDLLFIDGDHSYEGVLTDLTTWVPFLRAGGILAMHDVYEPASASVSSYEAGPLRAIDEYMLRTPELWAAPTLIEYLLIVPKIA